MQTVKNNPAKAKKPSDGDGTGEFPPEDGGGGGDDKPEEPGRTPATEAEYLAVKLHSERANGNKMRGRLAEKEETIANLTAQIGGLRKTVLTLETLIEDRENAALREKYDLKDGYTISRDDDTGECWWTKTKSEQAKQ